MTDKILSFILCLSVTVVFSQNVTLIGNCSREIPPEPLSVWGIPRAPLRCSLWGTKSCSNGQLPPQVGGTVIDTLESLEIESVLIMAPNGDLAPQLIVTWKPSISDDGLENLKGFYMEVHKLTGTAGSNFICRVFDFSESRFTTEDYKLTFQKKFVQFPGGPKYLHRLDMYTLPRSPQSMAKRVFFMLQAPMGKNDTANWSASITYKGTNLTAPATITVSFSLAPHHYGITSYLVQLVDRANDKNALVSCYVDLKRADGYECQGKIHLKPQADATTVSHSFSAVPQGIYSVLVQAHDPNWQNEDCLCYHGYHDDNGKRRRNCGTCTTTQTGTFVVSQSAEPEKVHTSTRAVLSSENSATTPPDQSVRHTGEAIVRHTGEAIVRHTGEAIVSPQQYSNVTVVAGVLGGVLVLVVVTVVVVVIRRNRGARTVTD